MVYIRSGGSRCTSLTIPNYQTSIVALFLILCTYTRTQFQITAIFRNSVNIIRIILDGFR